MNWEVVLKILLAITMPLWALPVAAYVLAGIVYEDFGIKQNFAKWRARL